MSRVQNNINLNFESYSPQKNDKKEEEASPNKSEISPSKSQQQGNQDFQSSIVVQDINLAESQVQNQDNQKDQEYDEENKEKIKDILLSVKIDKKFYSYKGPPHPDIISLFQQLQERQNQVSKYQLIEKFKFYKNFIETWFQNKCVFLNGRIKISFYDVLIFSSFWIVYFVYLGQTIALSTETEVQKSDWKSTIVLNAPWLGAVFTIYGLIYIYNQSIFISLLLFLGLVLVQVILLLYDFNLIFSDSSRTNNYDTGGYIAKMFPMALFGHWFIFSLVYNWIKTTFNEAPACLCGAVWCIVIPYFLTIQVMTYFIFTSSYDAMTVVNTIISMLIIPFGIFVLISWILLYYRLFYLPLSHIQSAISRLKEDITLGFTQSKEQPDDKPYIVWIKTHINKITSTTIGVIYLFAEYFLIGQLATLFQQKTIDTFKMTVIVFQIIIIPIFIILGIVISVSNRRVNETFLYVPLLLAAAPAFGFIPIGNLISDQGEFSQLQLFFYYGPPIAVIFWLSVALFGIQQRMYYLITTMGMCLFVAFPIGVLYPLTLINFFGTYNNAMELLMYSLTGSGIFILLSLGLRYVFILLFIGIQRYQKQESFFSLLALSYYNLRECGHFINAICFIIGYCLLISEFYNRTDESTPDEQGALNGLLVVFPIAFILINIVIQQRSLEIDEDLEDENIQKLEGIAHQSKDQEERLQKRQQQRNTIRLGIILPIAVFIIPVLVVTNQEAKTTLTCIMVGIPLCFIIYWVLTLVKNASEKYQNFFTPFLVSICWIFVLLPFGALIPYFTSTINNETEQFGDFMRSVVLYTATLFIIGVTLFAIFFHIILNKLELEKLKKFVVSRLLASLRENGINSDVVTLSQLFERFKQIDNHRQRMTKLLEERSIVDQWPDDDKSSEYANILVTKKQYQTLLQKNKKIVQEKQTKSYLDWFWDIVCCRIGQDEKDDNNNDDAKSQTITRNDLYGDDEDIRQYMDKYLPKQIQNNKKEYEIDEKPKKLADIIERGREQIQLEQFMNTYGAQKKKRQEIFSSKTQLLREMKRQSVTKTIANNYKFTDHGKSMLESEGTRIEFLHDVWDQFSQRDDNFPQTIIYNDYLEFMRLSSIYVPEIIDEFADDCNFIEKEDLDKYYDKNASQAWQNGLLVLNLENFANLIVQLGLAIYPTSPENKTLSFQYLINDIIYPNLMQNLTNFALNYRPNVRMALKMPPERIQELTNSPFFKILYQQIDIDSYQEQFKHRQQVDAANQQRNKLFQQSVQAAALAEQLAAQQAQQGQIIPLNSSQLSQSIKPKKPILQRTIFFICRMLRQAFCIWPLMLYKYIDQKYFAAFKKEKQEKYQIKDVDKNKKVIKRKGLPWEYTCEIIITTLFDSEKEYKEQSLLGKFIISVTPNSSNILAIYGRAADAYGFINLAFQNNVNWYPGMSGSNEAMEQVNGSYSSNFKYMFGLALSMAITFAYLTKIANKYVQKDTLGLDEDGNKASFPHRQFFLVRFLNLLGGSQFMLIMKNFINTYVCTWEDQPPFKMYSDQNIVCLGSQHTTYMFLGLVGVILYYPLATFMYPNFQFLDRSLDLKYDPSYMVLYIQVKLLVLGAASIFKTFATDEKLQNFFQLSFGSFLLFTLALFVAKMQPCLVKIVNIFDIALYLIISIILATAAVIVYTDFYLVSLFVMLPLISIVVLNAIRAYKQFMDKNQKHIIKKINLGDLPRIVTTERSNKVKEEKQNLQTTQNLNNNDQVLTSTNEIKKEN